MQTPSFCGRVLDSVSSRVTICIKTIPNHHGYGVALSLPCRLLGGKHWLCVTCFGVAAAPRRVQFSWDVTTRGNRLGGSRVCCNTQTPVLCVCVRIAWLHHSRSSNCITLTGSQTCISMLFPEKRKRVEKTENMAVLLFVNWHLHCVLTCLSGLRQRGCQVI